MVIYFVMLEMLTIVRWSPWIVTPIGQLAGSVNYDTHLHHISHSSCDQIVRGRGLGKRFNEPKSPTRDTSERLSPNLSSSVHLMMNLQIAITMLPQ